MTTNETISNIVGVGVAGSVAHASLKMVRGRRARTKAKAANTRYYCRRCKHYHHRDSTVGKKHKR